jgi:hypothetical protein
VTDLKLTLHFRDISSGTFDHGVFLRDWGSEDLQPFTARPVDDVSWLGGARCAIYCDSAVPDPGHLIISLYDHLQSIGCSLGVTQFLNCPAGRLSDFVVLASGHSFNLANGPEAICNFLQHELQSQGVKFNVVSAPGRRDRGLLIEFGGSQFACREAFAEFDG